MYEEEPLETLQPSRKITEVAKNAAAVANPKRGDAQVVPLKVYTNLQLHNTQLLLYTIKYFNV